MEADGYDTPEEDENVHLTPSKMTIKQLKDLLVEKGHEDKVWQMTQAKAKKPQYVQAANDVLGLT